MNEIWVFSLASFAMVITPGPNMIYLVSRSITQGRNAGVLSLAGVISGFLFHIVMVAFGLTAILLSVPYVFGVLKIAGACYLLYLAYGAVKPGSKNVFETTDDLPVHNRRKLFAMGFVTNVLNPKMAVFYLSLFPQFIKPELGFIGLQCLQLGCIQMLISFTVNFWIIQGASRAASWFAQNPTWVRAQKWLMASVLAGLAIKMISTRAK